MTKQTQTSFDVNAEQHRIKLLVENILFEAKKLGADACEVGATSNVGLSATVRKGDVETVEFNKDQGVSIVFYSGKSKGSASTSDMSDEVIKKTVAAACNIARYTQDDPYSGLAVADQMATTFPELDLYHPWNITADEVINFAKECEQAGFDFSDKITNSEGASISTYQECNLYANSHGFFGESKRSRQSASCVLIAQKDDEMQRDHWYSTSIEASALENMASIGRKAAERTVSRLGGSKINTGGYPVIFHAEVASSLFDHFVSAINGGNLYRDSSFLKGALGQRIFPDWVHIHENPYLLRGFGSGSFDGDGLQTRSQDFVTDGILSNYILSTYSARKLGMKSTANAGGVRNLFIDSNAGGIDELLKIMDTGLLVTDFIGSSVNIVTGDYSRGVSGFWVENGIIKHPVAELTIAGNLKEMFNGIVYVGNDVDPRKSTYTGSVMINNMVIAGN